MWPLYVKNMTKQKSVFHWEIAFKYQILPVKRRNLIRENPRKLLISYPWKKNPSVKNSLKVSVKILDCPWKVGKKCAWKPVLYPWKNSKKGPKMAFTGTFDFHGEKKNAACKCRHPQQILKPIVKNFKILNKKFEILSQIHATQPKTTSLYVRYQRLCQRL